MQNQPRNPLPHISEGRDNDIHPANGPAGGTAAGDNEVQQLPPRALTKDEKDWARISHDVMAHLKTDRHMSMWDVIALNLNCMIGTGIFTTPGLVLALTRSKIMTLTLWFAGGIYALLGVYIYGRYSKHMLVNGGEFLWLDAVFKQPKYFFAITTAGFFLVLDNSAGNCLAFSKHVALMRKPTATQTGELERDVVAYIAVSVLTIVCFVHFFSPRVGLFLNKYFALFKVAFLIAIIVAGIRAGFLQGSGRDETWGWHEKEKPLTLDVMSAIIFIVYSYTGWQSAFYVAGEVGQDNKPHPKKLRRGAMISVLIVSVLYILTTLAYCLAIPFDKLAGDNEVGSELTIVVNFIPRAFNTSNIVWAKLFIACSALGFLVSTIYAYSRLNQKIFRQRFFPFYQLCDRDHAYYKTPTGGLVVHWFSTMLTIAITPNTPGGYGFMINVKSYGHIGLTFFLGIGILFLHKVRASAPDTKPHVIGVGALLALASLFQLIVSPLGHGSPSYWLWPVAVVVVIGFFTIYWAIFMIWVWYSSHRELKNRVLVYEYYPEVHMLELEKFNPATSGRWSRVLGTPTQAMSPVLTPPTSPDFIAAGHFDNNYSMQPRQQQPPSGVQEADEAQATATHAETADDTINRGKEKLAYRWNMWGERRFIVYEWSPSVKRKLNAMYKLFGMPHDTTKEIPFPMWIRYISDDTGQGGASSGLRNGEAYRMVRLSYRDSIAASLPGSLRGIPQVSPVASPQPPASGGIPRPPPVALPQGQDRNVMGAGIGSGRDRARGANAGNGGGAGEAPHGRDTQARSTRRAAIPPFQAADPH